MGGVYSSVTGYVDVWKMDTYAEIDYQDELRAQFETIRAFGRQEALTQSVRAGGFGGGGTPYGVSNKFGNNANFWIGINSWLYDFALPMAVIGLILGGWGYLAATGGLFFAGCFFVLVAVGNFVTFSQTQAGKRSYKDKYFYSNFLGSLVFAGIALSAVPLAK